MRQPNPRSDHLCQCRRSRAADDGNYDALFCRECLRWKESKCGSEHCGVCANRPPRFQMTEEHWANWPTNAPCQVPL